MIKKNLVKICRNFWFFGIFQIIFLAKIKSVCKLPISIDLPSSSSDASGARALSMSRCVSTFSFVVMAVQGGLCTDNTAVSTKLLPTLEKKIYGKKIEFQIEN